ncbi:MAG: ornithine cyclodeaminase family protein [Actinobacteria bacterium]|nr:ornithine cyclodeaminase family protein [Actinomycetota bacterium]
MLHLADEEVAALGREAGREEIVATVETALRAIADGSVEQPTKSSLHPSDDVFFHVMPVASAALGTAAIKWAVYAPGNSERGLPRTSVVLMLSDVVTGRPLCLLDGAWLTGARTGACAAVAANRLARADSRVLTMVGGGPVNRDCLPYLVDALPSLEEVRVLASDLDSARRHVASLGPQFPALTMKASGTAEEAVVGADVVISAIGHQPEPVLRGSWLGPGALALPLEGEAAWDDAAFTEVERLIADDREVFEEGFRRNRPSRPMPSVHAELAEVVAGTAPGRRSDDERIIDSNNGIGVLDLALGRMIFDRAVAGGVGTSL